MNTFKCPECGSTEVGSHLYVSPDPSSYQNVDDPWSHVLQQIECGDCNNCIPSHLGERWLIEVMSLLKGNGERNIKGK